MLAFEVWIVIGPAHCPAAAVIGDVRNDGVVLPPLVTVIVPEVPVKESAMAWILADPARCPVNAALLLSPLGTRSVETTPPKGGFKVVSDHAAAAFVTSLLPESRSIA